MEYVVGLSYKLYFIGLKYRFLSADSLQTEI